MPPGPTASIVVRARDEAAEIGAVLDRLAEQTLRGAEVIVVDSGSVDGTPDIARGRGARVIEIPAASFTFGGALNTGCAAASGEVCVALSAHALPPDDGWLGRIVGACAEEGVACASGDRYDLDGRPLDGRVHQDAAMARRQPLWGYSNAAGAFRRELWEQRPFRADLPGAEDKEWAWGWLRQGWTHVIGSDLVVEHDHTHDPVRDVYARARREWAGFAMFLELGPYPLRALAREWWSDLGTYRSPLRARLSHRRAARLLGAYAGRRGA
ncbi:MAG: glycosyl transferase family 2 [Solirubrobacterales bacterium]|nr:glycosyl transferase family 2 [Solirubrobacterales bacterium]